MLCCVVMFIFSYLVMLLFWMRKIFFFSGVSGWLVSYLIRVLLSSFVWLLCSIRRLGWILVFMWLLWLGGWWLYECCVL